MRGTTTPMRALLAGLAAAATLLAGVPMALAASTLPVHDQAVERAPAEYSDFMLLTRRNVTPGQVTDVEGMTVTDSYDTWTVDGGASGTFYVPQRTGASLTLERIGQWRDPASGRPRWLDATLTVTETSMLHGGSMSGAFNLTPAGSFQWMSPRADGTKATRFAFSVDLTLSDTGRAPEGLRGATGFTDLDGSPDRPDTVQEGIELLSGFDAAYVRHDAHLKTYGTNGWGGVRDRNTDDSADTVHAFQHYLGATFTGSHLEVRYTTRARLAGMFLPVKAAAAYPLAYDLQGGSGTVPNQREEGE